MTARRAYAFVHARLIAPLDHEARLEVAAILGDEAAEAEMQRRRREAVLALGGDIA